MKKTILTILAILLIGAGLMMGEGAAQSPPAMKVVLTFPPDKETYSPGEPIEAFLNIANLGTTDIITSKGFSNTSFHLLLVITDPDGKIITTNSLGASNPYTPLLPELAPVMTPEGEKMLQVESVEIWPAAPDPDWSRSFKFNLLEYYTVQKGGKYVAKALIPMRTYSYPIFDPTHMYALLGSSNWAGNIESNIANFMLTALDHITISPPSSTITAGGSQSYTATGYDQNNNSLGEVSGTTIFSITPDGSCTGNTCTATVVGPHTVTGADGGKTATASLLVVYTFTGFFPPVNNPPVLNVVKAGAAVPVKFSLNGDQGLSIFVSGYPTSGRIDCESTVPQESVEETVTAGSSSLSYDPISNQYIYVWKTNKAWSNTCRQLVIKFKDGTEYYANFKFTK